MYKSNDAYTYQQGDKGRCKCKNYWRIQIVITIEKGKCIASKHPEDKTGNEFKNDEDRAFQFVCIVNAKLVKV